MCHDKALHELIDGLNATTLTLARRQADLTHRTTQNEIDISFAEHEQDRLAYANAMAAGWSLLAEQLELDAECAEHEAKLLEQVMASAVIDPMDLGPLGAMLGGDFASLLESMVGAIGGGSLSAGYPAGSGVVFIEMDLATQVA